MAIDVTDATFQTDVLDRSQAVPVMVDLWAPWCGPCRIVSPALEQLTREFAGKVKLAKVNVDEAPKLSSGSPSRPFRPCCWSATVR